MELDLFEGQSQEAEETGRERRQGEARPGLCVSDCCCRKQRLHIAGTSETDRRPPFPLEGQVLSVDSLATVLH